MIWMILRLIAAMTGNQENVGNKSVVEERRKKEEQITWIHVCFQEGTVMLVIDSLFTIHNHMIPSLQIFTQCHIVWFICHPIGVPRPNFPSQIIPHGEFGATYNYNCPPELDGFLGTLKEQNSIQPPNLNSQHTHSMTKCDNQPFDALLTAVELSENIVNDS